MNEDTRREDSVGSMRAVSDSELHKQVAAFAAPRLAISEVLRAIGPFIRIGLQSKAPRSGCPRWLNASADSAIRGM